MPDEAAAVAASANADRTAAALQRLSERLPERRLDDEGLRRLAVVSGASESLGDLASSDASALDVLTGPLEPLSVEAVAARCADGLAEAASPAAALAHAQQLGLLNVAARDLLGIASIREVTAELSDLAQGVLGTALDLVTRDTGVKLLVVAMGKLGGRELNYVSDVDVVFVCDGDWTEATRAVERFLRLLGQVTPAGRAYEVDPNLRPEGKDGPLVRSLDAYDSYYGRWAKSWEFQALLKARPIAGDPDLADGFQAMAARHVWSDRLDAAAVGEIQRMKGVVEDSRQVRRAGARQVKLAPGGLRDIEFAVQLLQLVHGRHDPSLRTPNTLDGLAALADGAYVGEEDADAFADAYGFLRTVEHRLQLVRLRRTHTLPASDDDRRRLARTMGFAEADGGDPVTAFDGELRRVQGLTRELHAKLFYRPLLTRFAELGSDERLPVAVVATPAAEGEVRMGEEAARERLQALGFTDARAALRHLEALASGVTRRARLFATVLPALLPTLAESPDPDGGLAALRALADRLGTSPFLLRTIRDDPPVADLLAAVLGTSSLVGGWLERQPEVLGDIAKDQRLREQLTADDYRRRVDGMRRRAESTDDAAAALRRLRRREVARIAVRNIAGHAGVVDVATELSGVAEACLQGAVDEVTADLDLRMAVIGMGKLGGSELGYASDLDILLVFEPADARAQAEEAAEALLRFLSEVTPEGTVFAVDPNLRPEGKDGPLTRTLSSYRQYYERWGEPWELQALTQARHVAGDRALGRSFVTSMTDLVYPPRLPRSRVDAMRRMKARVESERGAAKPSRVRPGRRIASTAGERVDLKVGEGGLSDVDWTVQMIQQRSGGELPSLRRPGTLAALEACVDAGVLDAADGEWLTEGWTFLMRVRNALYLAGARDTAKVPAGADKVERLARMLGYERPGTQAFTQDLTRVMRRVRRVHERCFYEA